MLTIIILTGSLLIIAFLGGGIFLEVVIPSSLFLSTTALYVAIKNRHLNSSGIVAILISSLIFLLTLTIIPLPIALSPLTGAQRHTQNNIAEQALSNATNIGLTEKTTHGFCISRNRSGTIRLILLLISACSCALISSRLAKDHQILLIQHIVFLGLLIAVAGFISQWIIPQGKSIWWTFTVAHGSPVGCFINRNHFGGYLAMIAPSAITLSIAALTRKQWISAAVWSSSFIGISFAIITSLSRGAWIAWLFSTAITCSILIWKTKNRRLTAVLICLLAASVPAMIALSSENDVSNRLKTFENITQTESALMRLATWRDSLGIIRQYPLMGIGGNAFRMIFPQYRTSSTRKEFKHMENEYLQIPIETGLIGIFLISAVFISIFTIWRKQRHPDDEDCIVSICVLGAIIAVAVHAFLDFAIRVPLYMLTFTSLLGLLIHPAQNLAQSKKNISFPILCCTAGIVLSLLLYLTGGRNNLDLDSPDHITEASPAELTRTLIYSPTSWQAWYHLGNAAITSGLPDSYPLGEKCISQASEYDPLNYRLWEQLCRVRLYLHDNQGAIEAYNHLKTLRPWKSIKELEQLNKDQSL